MNSDSCAAGVMPEGSKVGVSGLMALPLKEPHPVIGAVTPEGTEASSSAVRTTATEEAALPLVMSIPALGDAALLFASGQRDR